MNLLNTYRTNICRKAFEHWCVYSSVREFSQNCIVDGEEGYYELREDDGTFLLGNRNVKLSPQTLLMGKSDKRDDPSKVGTFGTGMLIGISVLLDHNIDIEMANCDVIWKPVFKYCSTYQDDILVIEEYENPNPCTNYEVHISNLQEADTHNIIETTLFLQDRKVLASTEYGDLIENPSADQGGEIFVSGLFVTQNNKLKYSYNFKPEYMNLNQDRNLADTWELQQLTAKLWARVEDKNLLAEAIKSDSEDCYLVGDKFWTETDTDAHAASETLAEDFFEDKGDCIITNNYNHYKEMREAGNTVEFINNAPLYRSIKHSDKYKSVEDNMVVVTKETPYDKVYKIVDDIKDFMYYKDIIPSELHATTEEKEHENYYIFEQLELLLEEASEWRN